MKHAIDRFRGVRAFFSALCAAITLLLLAMGLLTADVRSRRVRDGVNAVREDRQAQDSVALPKTWQTAADALWQALPARARAIGIVWDAERELTKRWIAEAEE